MRDPVVSAVRQALAVRHHGVRSRFGRVGRPAQPPGPDVQPLQEVQRQPG